MIENGGDSKTLTAIIHPTFIYQDFLYYGSQGSFGTISAMNGQTPIMYKNAMYDDLITVQSATKEAITLMIKGYSRVILISHLDFTVTYE